MGKFEMQEQLLKIAVPSSEGLPFAIVTLEYRETSKIEQEISGAYMVTECIR